MSKALLYLLELLGVAGIVGLIAFIPWTKMALGATLSFLGAFFPTIKAANPQGEGEVSLKNFVARFSGGIRVGVVLGGVILIVGALLDGYEEKERNDKELARKLYEEILGENATLSRDELRRILEGVNRTSEKANVPATAEKGETLLPAD